MFLPSLGASFLCFTKPVLVSSWVRLWFWMLLGNDKVIKWYALHLIYKTYIWLSTLIFCTLVITCLYHKKCLCLSVLRVMHLCCGFLG